MARFLYRTRIESEALVSHPSFRTSYRTLPSVHRIAPLRHHMARAKQVRYDVARVRYDVRKEGRDTSVSDSIRVRYKNHAMISYK